MWRKGRTTGAKVGGPTLTEGKAVNLGVRPEHISLGETGTGQLDGVVDVCEYLGADTNIFVDAGTQGQITVRSGGETDLRPGDQVGMALPEEDIHFFDSEGWAICHGTAFQSL